MSLKKLIKHGLLRFGGYTMAHSFHKSLERRRLLQRIKVFKKHHLLPLPDLGMFEPTQRCNLRCHMCFQDRTSLAHQQELTMEQIVDFFQSYPNFKQVTLVGGEIFMRRDIVDLIAQLNRLHDLILCTNGTLIGTPEFDRLKKCQRIFTISLSLDGPEDIHESIRGVRGSYAKAVQSISTLVPIFPVTVNSVIQDENITLLPEIVDFCAKRGVRRVKLELERLYPQAQCSQTIRETALEDRELHTSTVERQRGYSLKTLEKVLGECQRRSKAAGIALSFDPPFLPYEMQACYDNTLRAKRQCLCHGFRTATIAPNGDVIHCFILRKSFGNITEAPLEEIWKSGAAQDFRKQLLQNNLTALCENCPFMILL